MHLLNLPFSKEELEPKPVELAPKVAEQILFRLKYKFPTGAPKPSDAENLAFTSAFYQILDIGCQTKSGMTTETSWTAVGTSQQ